MKKKQSRVEKLYGSIKLLNVPRCECGLDLPRINWLKVWREFLPDGSQWLYVDRHTRAILCRLVESQLRRKAKKARG